MPGNAGGMEFTLEVDTVVLSQLIAALPSKAESWMDSLAEWGKNDIKESYGESPSAAGDPPGVDTGNLRAGIDWEKDGKMRRIIHDQTNYGIMLELGTSRMAARPHFGPAFERLRQNLPSLVPELEIMP